MPQVCSGRLRISVHCPFCGLHCTGGRDLEREGCPLYVRLSALMHEGRSYHISCRLKVSVMSSTSYLHNGKSTPVGRSHPVRKIHRWTTPKIQCFAHRVGIFCYFTCLRGSKSSRRAGSIGNSRQSEMHSRESKMARGRASKTRRRYSLLDGHLDDRPERQGCKNCNCASHSKYLQECEEDYRCSTERWYLSMLSGSPERNPRLCRLFANHGSTQ